VVHRKVTALIKTALLSEKINETTSSKRAKLSAAAIRQHISTASQPAAKDFTTGDVLSEEAATEKQATQPH
jgi:hypothetical protein